MRALVVDDSRTMRIILGTFLRQMGIEVVEAGNGIQALEQMRLNPDVGLILVDWNMPEMNGLDFTVAIRAENLYDHVRILMVTSESGAEQVKRAISAGCNEYLMKPFTKEVLAAKLSLMDLDED
jgi:two-component system chemotaxis response regulator CheY